MRGRGVGETLVDILHKEGPQGLFRRVTAASPLLPFPMACRQMCLHMLGGWLWCTQNLLPAFTPVTNEA